MAAIQKVYEVSMTSGATLSDGADLGAVYERLYLEVPTMASGSLYIQASSDDSTFRRMTQVDPNQATDFVINSAVTQRIVRIPTGFQYYKVESTSGATDTTTLFNFIGSNPRN
jgi:hypothetical protein